MSFDGITTAALVSELNNKILNGKINKIAQPEKDELLFTIKQQKTTYRLLLSANPSLPFGYLTDKNKVSPLTAPNFCMLLRKHISSGRILSIKQPSLERVLQFEIEHLDELGDVKRKFLIFECMGKHSNLIFCDENLKIIDSIKHISLATSSIREVLPGRDYFIPNTMEKINPFELTEESFINIVKQSNTSIGKTMNQHLTGFSPLIAQEICYSANMDYDRNVSTLWEDTATLSSIYKEITGYLNKIKKEEFAPVMYMQGQLPVAFYPFSLKSYSSYETESIPSISELLEKFYEKKNTFGRIRQKSLDLRKTVNTAYERSIKKLDLQKKQLKDTEKMDQYRIYGELLQTYAYQIETILPKVKVFNYYTNEDISIPMDIHKSVIENANRYFDKYNKLKRTKEALGLQLKETENETQLLSSIQTALDLATDMDDLNQIRQELVSYGIIKFKGRDKKKESKVKPLVYRSSDGYEIYVGKNNIQNEMVTFKIANGGDFWFHAKNIPGSHVIIKGDGKEIPDKTMEEAASLAAYYSKSRDAKKVEVDYIQRKFVKKSPGQPIGFVIYHTNYSMVASTDISAIELIN